MYRDNIVIIVALASSVGMHALVLPMVYSDSPSMTFAPPVKATHLETHTFIKDIDLGIDQSDESTLTWIGYDDYEEQIARFAEVEQASMKAEVDVSNSNPSLAIISQVTRPIVTMTKKFLDALQAMNIRIASRALPVKDRREIKQDTLVEPVIAKEHTVGNSSDRDSDATSIIRVSVDKWKSGKPLAAKGIVLRPRRPSFTANQMVSYNPSDLVAELSIDNSGKPVEVSIVVSTGSSSIDRSLVSSLYRWRASGNRISALKNRDTIKITIHLMFSR